MYGDPRARATPKLWGRIACAWAIAFALLHFHWALGGSWGLDVSAGPLADERPLWFVVVGLWGVGLLCLIGGVLGWVLARPRPRNSAGAVARLLGWCVCAVLLVRAIVVEVLLLIPTTGQETAVSSEQRLWTLLLWNPWLLVGGVAFGLAARGFEAARVRDGEPADGASGRS